MPAIFLSALQLSKCTKYETCAKLHRFHILYVSCGCRLKRVIISHQAPKHIESSWEELVEYLTSIYRTDMMKVRSLFAWLGTQSIENESFIGVSTPNDISAITPRGYKKVIKDREGSYATLFALLCRYTTVLSAKSDNDVVFCL